MDELSRRQLLKLSAAGAGVVILPGVAACGSSFSGTSSSSNGSKGRGSPPAELTGRIVHSGEARYDKARTDWDGLFSSYPLVIVFAQEAQDIVNALTWSRQTDV